MAAWLDPILPKLKTPSPEELRATPMRLGDAIFYLLPKQWDFMWCTERFPTYTAGYGAGKTKSGIYRGARLSMQPNNIGIVGRAASTDLVLTTQRDMLDFFKEANLLKSEPGKKFGAIVYCVDPFTNKSLGETSEIQFQHMEDPDHLHGYQVGWAWPDERSEIPYASWLKLIGRMRLAHIPVRSAFATGNPNGHDWGYDYWFNPEKVMALPDSVRLQRRGIHATSFENYYLDPQYIEDMKGSYPEEWLQRYLMGDMDVFEGQAFKEFAHEIHCVESRMCSGFINGEPPESWVRYLGIDVGGVDPWAFEFAAIDQYGNIVFYDEIYKPGVYAGDFAEEAKKKMKDRNFVAKVIDWENKLAAEELRRHGITVTNARKRGKMDSITQFGGYLHPNPKRPYPEWHPKRGLAGSPGVFFTERCPHLIREVSQQRWKKMIGSEHALNVLDDKLSNHGFDACLYVCKERPRPEMLPKTFNVSMMESGLDKRNAAWRMLEIEHNKYKEQQKAKTRMPWPPLRQAPPSGEHTLWN